MAKRKDAPSSVLTRSGRKTSTGIQASTNPLNTRKSPRFQKQMGPAPSTVKKKPEKRKKQIGSTPLRRSERGRNTVDVHASNFKSTEKFADISEEIAEEGTRDLNGGSKKRKRYHAVEFKARKSPRFQKQMGPTTRSTVKKKPEKSQKQMGSTPLRRSERGKNPVDVPASNVKSIENSAGISEEIAEEGSQDSNGGSKKRKRYHAVEFKARKSPRFQKQMGPTTRSTVKKIPEKSEKQMGSTPLRRSERGKNPVDVPASNVKSIENSAGISEEIAEEGSQDSNGGSKKRKRYHAVEFKARKSPRFQKQMGPTTRSTVKKIPEKSEKQMGSTPLRRSERGKNPVDVPASNVKSIEKSADISEESAEDGSRNSYGGSKKRKRYQHAVEFKACYKPQQVRVETEGSEVLAHTESPSSSGDQFWSAAYGRGTPIANETADGNANGLYQHLKPTVSKLCNILKFSEGAMIIVERFLKFVVENFNVSKEHTNILQALMISVCWICSSLSKHTIDRKESFALAKEHLNFSCKEEEADQVYEKLKKPKEMFLQSPKNLKVLDAFIDRASRPEEPRMSPAFPLNQQEQKRENHGSSNEEALQSSGQILEEDIARKERNEIDKFDSEWDEKRMTIVNDFRLEKTLIRYLYGSNSSIRSEKLNLAEKEFADKLNEHERLRQVSFNDLKAMLKDAVGQVVVNDEISVHTRPGSWT